MNALVRSMAANEDTPQSAAISAARFHTTQAQWRWSAGSACCSQAFVYLRASAPPRFEFRDPGRSGQIGMPGPGVPSARCGMRAPELAVGDGALGFWNALAEVFPATRAQRCWVHKTANVLDSMPKSAQPGVKKALQDIYNAEDRDHAAKAIKAFANTYGAKFPRAVRKITDDEDELLAFYDYPAEHWIHLCTTNPIASTFATVRLRAKVAKGAGSAAAALAMVFKLVEAAQARWRAISGAHLVALVRAGARFENGVLVERDELAA